VNIDRNVMNLGLPSPGPTMSRSVSPAKYRARVHSLAGHDDESAMIAILPSLLDAANNIASSISFIGRLACCLLM
jgi:hypothetical protein